MKHYLSLIDPNVKAAIETSVLARRAEEPIRRAEAERQVAARRAHMQAAARGRRELVARDGDEGGDSDGSEVAYTPPETPAAARAAEERIYAAARDAAYKVQLDTFKAEMYKVTAMDVHERLWTSLTRDGFMERPSTLAARMHRAHAIVRTSTTQDMNRRFLSRVLEPWASVHALHIRRHRLVEDRLDLETGRPLSQLSRDRCVDRIGHMARVVEEIEQEQREREADDALALERVAQMAGDSDRTLLQRCCRMPVRGGRRRDMPPTPVMRRPRRAMLRMPMLAKAVDPSGGAAPLQKPNQDKQRPPGAAHAGEAQADGQPDGEGKHSRKQRNGRSRQPKHKGAFMHAAGGGSPEHESWEDAYYLGMEDGTTMVAIRAVEHAAEEEGSHCGGEAVAARLSTLMYGVKGRSGRKPCAGSIP
eukprot:jgi/Tetstr1/437788/TSEL_002829.t1